MYIHTYTHMLMYTRKIPNCLLQWLLLAPILLHPHTFHLIIIYTYSFTLYVFEHTYVRIYSYIYIHIFQYIHAKFPLHFVMAPACLNAVIPIYISFHIYINIRIYSFTLYIFQNTYIHTRNTLLLAPLLCTHIHIVSYLHIHKNIYTDTHTYTQTQTQKHLHTPLHEQTYTHSGTHPPIPSLHCLGIFTKQCKRGYVYTCMYIYVHTYVYACVYMHTHTHIEDTFQ